MIGIRQCVVAPIALALLAGCSGGGGGSSGGGGTVVTPTPTPAVATASLSAGATRAMVGESVSLTWSSTNAAACTASGDWSAAIATSGTSTVSFTTAGTKTLTLTCGAATASATVTAVAPVTYTIPNDLAAISYPASYTTPTAHAADLDNPLCNTGLTAITYPQSWMGRYPLPVLSGAPMTTGVQRGISMKDVWEKANAAYVTGHGCTATARAEWTRTVTRIKALGADYVTITPWTFIGVRSNGDWYIQNPAELNTSTMDDTDLAWAVGEAHRVGLKVVWLNQIQGMQVGNVVSVPASNRANVTRFFDAELPYLLERATYLQSLGVDTMSVSCTCFAWLEDVAYADIYEARMAALLPQIRARFSGKLRLRDHPAIMTNATIRNNVDEMVISLYLNMTPAEVPTLTTAILRGKFEQTLFNYETVFRGLTKPIIFEVGAPSRTDFYTTTYLEETFCTANFGEIIATDGCIQRTIVPDLSLQAMFYEAYLEAVKNQTRFVTGGIESTGYWLVDGIQPSSSFPNIGYSPRNKPAEGILKAWFAR